MPNSHHDSTLELRIKYRKKKNNFQTIFTKTKSFAELFFMFQGYLPERKIFPNVVLILTYEYFAQKKNSQVKVGRSAWETKYDGS